MNKRITQLNVLLSERGRTIRSTVVIIDGYAFATFEDPTLAKKIVEEENEAGNKSIKYDKKRNAVVEEYKGMTMEEITKKVATELRKNGGELLE